MFSESRIIASPYAAFPAKGQLSSGGDSNHNSKYFKNSSPCGNPDIVIFQCGSRFSKQTSQSSSSSYSLHNSFSSVPFLNLQHISNEGFSQCKKSSIHTDVGSAIYENFERFRSC